MILHAFTLSGWWDWCSLQQTSGITLLFIYLHLHTRSTSNSLEQIKSVYSFVGFFVVVVVLGTYNISFGYIMSTHNGKIEGTQSNQGTKNDTNHLTGCLFYTKTCL